MNCKIERHPAASLSDDDIRATIAHSNRIQKEALPDDPELCAEEAIAFVRNSPSYVRHVTWLVRTVRGIDADADLHWVELDANRHLASCDVAIAPGLRRAGLGTRLIGYIARAAQEEGRSLLLAWSSSRMPAGAPFLAAMGFEQGQAQHTNQLVLAGLDRGLMADWIARGLKRAGHYRIEFWHGPVPEADLAAYARLTGVMNSAPRDGLEIEDETVTPEEIREGEASMAAAGMRRLIAVARHVPTGGLAGFTAVGWSPRRASIVWQWATGVAEEHRNQGLGRWLKAANVEALIVANPQARFVRTGNADSNAPMLAINRAMGFVPFTSRMIWQGRVPTVLERVAQRAA